MPIEMLAAAVVSRFLVPALKDGADSIAGAIADKIGAQAAQHTEGLLGKLWDKVDRAFGGGTDREQRTLDDFKADPDTYADAVTKILERKVEGDPSLAAEIEKLVEEPVPGTAMTGAQVWSAGVVGVADARQADFSHARNVRITGLQLGRDSDAYAVQPMPDPPPPPSAG